MTNEQWIEILRAYADWLEGSGPPVQYQLVIGGIPAWVDWLNRQSIVMESSYAERWRVKPQPIRSRQFYQEIIDPGRYLTGTVVWRPGECEPIPPTGCKWLGSWIDVPDTEDD